MGNSHLSWSWGWRRWDSFLVLGVGSFNMLSKQDSIRAVQRDFGGSPAHPKRMDKYVTGQ